MDNLRRAIRDATLQLPESGQPEQLRDCLKAVIDALVIIEEELRHHKRQLDE